MEKLFAGMGNPPVTDIGCRCAGDFPAMMEAICGNNTESNTGKRKIALTTGNGPVVTNLADSYRTGL